jgi:hypothetical protein
LLSFQKFRIEAKAKIAKFYTEIKNALEMHLMGLSLQLGSWTLCPPNLSNSLLGHPSFLDFLSAQNSANLSPG